MINGLAGKRNLKFKLTGAKQVLFWGKVIENFTPDPSLCTNKTCLIRLRYDKRFGGKTELNLIEAE
jgi:hypothetical protein